MDQQRDIEIREAIEAGRNALRSLQAAEQNLGSAGNWGIADMLGGGFITTMMKHSKIDDASEYMERARGDLRRFQKELRDIQVNTDFNLDIGDFLKFADFFFDGFIADYMVQSKIRDAERQIQEAKLRVENILTQLRTYQ